MKQALCTALGVVAVLMAGCRREAAQPTSPTEPLTIGVLVVDGVPLLPEDLEFELARRGARRDDADFDAVVEELVQRQRMVAEARRLGIDQEPATRRALDAVLVSRWKERQLEPRLADTNLPASASATASNPPPAATVGAARAELQSHVAILRLQFNARTSTARRDSLRERLTEARAKATQLAPSVAGFGALAVDYSDDDGSRSIGGDLGWISSSGSFIPGGDAVRRAIDSLQQAGEISPVIEGRDGFYLVRLIERRESSARGAAGRQEAALASHRAQLERRRAVEQAVMGELRDRIPVLYLTNALEEARAAWRAGRERRDAGPAAPPGGERP